MSQMIRGETLMSTAYRAQMVPPMKCGRSAMERIRSPERPPTSSRRATNRADAGFTLLEMVCVMAMVALLAAILLPRLPHGTTRPQLEAYAVQIAALFKSDRNAAFL